jgi:SsrA-binding protein
MSKNLNILNKKARFEYILIEKYLAGIALLGTEVKSIRDGKVSLNEAYCLFVSGELFIRNMNIAEYSHGNIHNHDPIRQRKLLLEKRELRKLHTKVKEKGFTIVPTRLFINSRGFVKMEIALAKGKNIHDKREAIKERDMKKNQWL